MQVGRGGKARGGRRGARSGRGGGGRGAQKRLPELEEWVPSYALREHWPSTTGLNSFAGTQPLPERCKGERLRPADVSHKGPNGSPSGECFQLDLRGKNETQPVLPTLFVPGFPKSATTWLWDCMHAAYLPEVVCRDAARTDPRAFRAGFDPRRWSKAGCSDADGTPRRFMLPGTACNVLGGCQHRKELFFYGGGFGNYFANGLASLHGPEVRRRPRGAHFGAHFGEISAQFRRNSLSLTRRRAPRPSPAAARDVCEPRDGAARRRPPDVRRVQAATDGDVLHRPGAHPPAAQPDAPVMLRRDVAEAEVLGLPLARHAAGAPRPFGAHVVPNCDAVGEAARLRVHLDRLHAELHVIIAEISPRYGRDAHDIASTVTRALSLPS